MWLLWLCIGRTVHWRVMGSSLCAAGYHKTPSVEGVDDAPGDERPNPLPLLSAGGGTLSSLSLPASLRLSLPVLLSHAWRPSPASPSASQWVEEAAGEFRV